MEQDIKDQILSDFGPEADSAISLLTKYQQESGVGSRVCRCIVHLASGDMIKLKNGIKDAQGDWRDVIS